MLTRSPQLPLTSPSPFGSIDGGAVVPTTQLQEPNTAYDQFKSQTARPDAESHLANYSVTEPAEKPDFFRDTLFRYVAYANELGEVFKSFITKKGYYGSYAVSTLYALADGVTKAKESYDNCKADHDDHKHPLASAAVTAVDVSLFHFFASVYLPGKIVAGIREFAKSNVPKHLVNTTRGKAIPIVVALGAIPIIVRPLDHAVNAALDLFRKVVDRPTEVLDKKATDVIGPLKLKPSPQFYEAEPLLKPALYSAFK